MIHFFLYYKINKTLKTLVNLDISIFPLIYIIQFYYCISYYVKSRVFGYPIRRVWIPGAGIGVPENISGRVLDRHFSDFRVWIPGFFRSGIHGYPYSHP